MHIIRYVVTVYCNRRLCLALPCNDISVPKEKYDTQGEKKLDIIFSIAFHSEKLKTGKCTAIIWLTTM